MRAKHPKVVTWAQLIALPADDCGPYRIKGAGAFSRDPRTGMWVPAEFVGPESTWRLAGTGASRSWFDTSSTDADKSLDLTSLPNGWSIAKAGTGDVTGGWVAGPASTPVVCTAPNGSSAKLMYTITGRTAADHLCVLVRMQGTTSGTLTNYTALLWGDATANRQGYDVLKNAAMGDRWYMAFVEYAGAQVAITDDHVHRLVATASGGASLATKLSAYPMVHISGSPLNYGTAVINYVALEAVRAAEAGNTTLSITDCAIYLGGA